MIQVLFGVSSGVLAIVFTRLFRAERWWYAIGLLVLPGLYALFAVLIGEWAIAGREMLYGMTYVIAGLILALKDLRHSAMVTGGFWIMHGGFDLLHDRLYSNPGVPTWYPVWCCSVDVVVGAYLIWLSTKLPEGNLRKA